MLELNTVRKEIDEIDKEIIRLLNMRFDCVKTIAKIKKENNLPIKDQSREEEIFKKIELSADPKYIGTIKDLYEHLIALSRQQQGSSSSQAHS